MKGNVGAFTASVKYIKLILQIWVLIFHKDNEVGLFTD